MVRVYGDDGPSQRVFNYVENAFIFLRIHSLSALPLHPLQLHPHQLLIEYFCAVNIMCKFNVLIDCYKLNYYCELK